MLVSQPTKVGKIGYQIALMGELICMLMVLDLLYHDTDLWDAFFIILGTSIAIIGYSIARRDTYIKHIGWRILLWKPANRRERIAITLLVMGGVWMVGIIAVSRKSYLEFPSSGYDWIPIIASAVLLLIGWALILTGREDPIQAQEHDSTST